MIAWYRNLVTNRKNGPSLGVVNTGKPASFLFTLKPNDKNILSIERYRSMDKSKNTTQVVYLEAKANNPNHFNSNTYDMTDDQHEEFVRKVAEQLEGCIVISKECAEQGE